MNQGPNLHNPYKYKKEANPQGALLFFETDYGVKYVAQFYSYGYLFGSQQLGCQFYSFDLVPIGAHKPPKGTPTDLRISDTVRAMFIDWLDQKTNIIVAIYEDCDSSQAARRKKFGKWFEDSGIEYIEKHDIDFKDRLTSLFIHVDFGNKDAAMENFIYAVENEHVIL